MPVVLENVVRMAIRGHWTDGQPIVNILHADIRGAGTVNRTQAVNESLTDIMQNWQSQVMAQLADNYVIDGMDWVDLDTADGRIGFEPPYATERQAGAVTNQQNTAAVTALVTKVCASRTRSRRNGRWYLPISSEGQITEDGIWFQTTINDINAACMSFRANTNQTPVDNRQVTIGVLSDPVTAPPKLLPITSFSMRAIIGIQRRRRSA